MDNNFSDVYEKIRVFRLTNYGELYREGRLCDYNINNTWRVGKISKVNTQTVIVQDFFKTKVEREIYIEDSKSISYFRNYTTISNYETLNKRVDAKVLGYLEEALDQIIGKDFSIIDEPYKIILFFRGIIFLRLDYILGPQDSSQKVCEYKMSIILKYVDVISKVLKFIKENMEIFLEYEGYKESEQKDIVLIDWRFAVVSAYPEMVEMYYRILGYRNNERNYFFCENCEFSKSYSQTFFSEVDQKVEGLFNEKILPNEKANIDRIKNCKQRNISLPVLYVIYYIYLRGIPKTVTSIITSKKDMPLERVSQFLNLLINLYKLTPEAGIIFPNEMQTLKQYIYQRIIEMSEVEIKECKKESIVSLINKMKYILPYEESTKTQIFEQVYLNYFFRCLRCKNLEKQIFAMNSFEAIINKIRSKTAILNPSLASTENFNNKKCDDIIKDMNYDTLALSFKSNKIIEFIFSENVHEEIVKRSLNILIIMYQCNWGLKEKEKIEERTLLVINSLFAIAFNQNNDESYSKYMKNFLCEFCKCLKNEHKFILYLKIKEEIQKNVISKENIQLLKVFTEKCFNKTSVDIYKNGTGASQSKEETFNEKKVFGLKLLWDYMQDETYTNLPLEQLKTKEKCEIILLSLDSIHKILNDSVISDQTRKMILSMCFEGIKNGSSVVQCCNLILKLCEKKSPYKSRYDQIIEQINKENDLTWIVVNDLERYLKKVKELEGGEGSKEDIASVIYEGNYIHDVNVEVRLNVIFMLINKERNIEWNYDMFIHFWNVCELDKCSKKRFFNLLRTNINFIQFQLLEEIFTRIFIENEIHFDYEDNCSYKLFKTAFFEVNTRNKSFLPLNDLIYRVNVKKKTKISGIEKLWELLVTVKEEDIQRDIAYLLCDLCLDVVSTEDPLTFGYWSNFIETINDYLRIGINDKKEVSIKGVLLLIRKLISKTGCDGPVLSEEEAGIIEGSLEKNGCYLYTFVKSPEKLSRVIEVYDKKEFFYTRCKLSYYFNIPINRVHCIKEYSINNNLIQREFNINDDFRIANDLFLIKHQEEDQSGIGIINKREINIFVIDKENPILKNRNNPKNLLFQSNDLFFTLINLLKDKNKSYMTDVWEILKENKENMTSNKIKSLMKVGSNEVDKKEEIELMNNIFDFETTSIYYFSHILSQVKACLSLYDEEERKAFSKSYAWNKKIKELFMKFTVSFDSLAKLPLNEVSETINCAKLLIDLFSSVYESNPENEDKEILIQKLFQFIYEIFALSIEKITDKLEIKANQIQAIEIFLFHIKKEEKFKREIFEYFISNEDIKSKIIKILLDMFFETKNEVIIVKFKDFLFSEIDPDFRKNPENKELEISLSKFLVENLISSKAIETLRGFIQKVKDENVFYEYFKILCKLIDITYEKFKLNSLFDYSSFVNNTILPFVFSENQSEILISGLVSMIFTIAKREKISFVNVSDNNSPVDFADYIINDLVFSKCNYSPLDSKPPKITSKFGTEVCYHLLVLLIYDNEEKLQQVLEKVNSFHSFPFWKTNKILDWKISSVLPRRETPFVGLKNLGCTCYLNSLMQILFTMKDFRERIINSSCPDEQKNVLYQIKKLFISLKYYESPYFEPVDFCRNFDDKVLNTSVQMDIEEFFLTLLDKIENRLKNTKDQNLVKDFFQGVLSDDLIFQGCNHVRKNDFSCYSIQLQVKNKKNVEESLSSLIEGETMDGDNSILCNECNKKIPAIKRQTFKTLPQTLIFVLKRFEFDYTTMKKIKLNDYYEFPFELDMTKYTSEFLETGKSTKSNEYKLRAIVIHSGHSEGGHYYDFLRMNDDEWYEFNDSKVGKIPKGNLTKEAYGGNEVCYNSKTQKQETVQKQRNAYLLVYEKVPDAKENNEPEQKKDEAAEPCEKTEKKEIIEKINQEMSYYYIKNRIFSVEYHMFILELLANEISLVKNFGMKNFTVFLSHFSKNQIELLSSYNEVSSLRGMVSLGSNLGDQFKTGEIEMYFSLPSESENTNVETPEIKEKIFKLFKVLMVYFLNVFLRSKEKAYLGGTNDLIRYLLNEHKECREYLIEEFCNKELIEEYLINCPLYEVKKTIVGLIFCAMIPIQTEYVKDNNLSEVEEPQETVSLQYYKANAFHKLESHAKEPPQIPKVNPLLTQFISNLIFIIVRANDIQGSQFLYYILYRFYTISPFTKADLSKKDILHYFCCLIFPPQDQARFVTIISALEKDYNYVPSNHHELAAWQSEESKASSIVKEKAMKYQKEKYEYLLFYNLLIDCKTNLPERLIESNYIKVLFKGVGTTQNACAFSDFILKLCLNNSDRTVFFAEEFTKIISNSDYYNDIQSIMICFKMFLTKKIDKDELFETRINYALKQYIKAIFRQSNYLSFMDYHIKFIINFFFSSYNMYLISVNFKSELEKMLRWYQEARESLVGQEGSKDGQRKKDLDLRIQKLACLVKSKEILINLEDDSPQKYLKKEGDFASDLTDFSYLNGDMIEYQ